MVDTESTSTFVFVSGCWHPPGIWDHTRKELEQLGQYSLAPELPISDLDATFDDHAQAVADNCVNETNVVLVGHSRAGNIIPRAAGLIATERLVFLCASFEPATLAPLGRPLKHEIEKMPARNPKNYSDAIIQRPDGLTDIDPEAARELFYGDCSKEVQGWAIAQLKPQYRSNNEPPMMVWPVAPQEYILCNNDLVTNPEWSRYIAQNWLRLVPIEMPGGHSPFLSRPRLLARILIALGARHGE